MSVLRWLREPPRAPGVETVTVVVAGAAVPVSVRRSASARRMTLRVPPGHENPIVTVPTRATPRLIERFVTSHAGWLQARLDERAPARPFAHGVVIPLRGEPHTIRAVASTRGLVRETREGPENFLDVHGRPEHVKRRTADFLRRTARKDLEVAVAEYAAAVGRRPTALRIKDTRAQWGSCTPAGALSFSWRLILAPPFVLRYVAAHEVAHLVELNHSPAFWRLNEALDPGHERARSWLRRNGRMLHAVGADGPAG